MSIATINLNVLAQTVSDRAAVEAAALQIGGGVLVMDDQPLATALRQGMGAGAIVAHRTYEVDDAELYLKTAPAAWVKERAPLDRNLLIQAHNEPHITTETVKAFVSWNVLALHEAHRRSMRLAVGAFGVGSPETALIEAGAFDPMLAALSASDALMVHEYFKVHPTAGTEYPWLCGRIRAWLERMRGIGATCKTIIVGEYGRDVAGGERDGWRDTGWSAAEYAQRMIDGMRQIYAPLANEFGVRIAVNVFCAGSGFGRWQSFDVDGEQEIYNAMAAWNAAQTDAGMGGGTAAPAVVIWTNSTYANVRAAPSLSGGKIGELRVSDPLGVYSDTPVSANGYSWQRVRVDEHDGYVATEVCRWRGTQAETNLVKLAVPFVSQLGGDADARHNDCGIAAALMLWQWVLQQAGVAVPRIVTVDRMISATPLAASDKPLSRQQVVEFLDGLGVRAALRNDMTLDEVRAEIVRGKPVIPLVAYRQIVPEDTFDGGHFLIVTGVSDQFVYMNDPYRGGADYRVTVEAFAAALRETVNVGAAGLPNLGIALVEAG